MFVPMDKARMGELALARLKVTMRKNGIKAPADDKREAGQVASELGVKPEEVLHFIETIHREIFAEMYPDK